MTRSGWIRPQRRRSHSSRAACWPSRSRLVFAVRAGGQDQRPGGLPELPVRGLDDTDAQALLAAACAGRSMRRYATGSSPRARGNPLALLELPRAR